MPARDAQLLEARREPQRRLVELRVRERAVVGNDELLVGHGRHRHEEVVVQNPVRAHA